MYEDYLMTKGEWMNQDCERGVVYVSVYMHVKGGGNVCKIKMAHEGRKIFHLASPCSLHGIDHCRRGSIHSRSLRHVGIIWSTRHFRNLPPVWCPRRCRSCCGECYRWGRWILDSILIHGVCGWSCRRGWDILALDLGNSGMNCRHSLELAGRLPVTHRCRWRSTGGAVLLDGWSR